MSLFLPTRLMFSWAIEAIFFFLNGLQNYSSAFVCVLRLANYTVIKGNYPLIGLGVQLSSLWVYTLVLLV